MTSNRIIALAIYLPIQKREKMCSSRSSDVRLPVISSSAARASCRSASTNSSERRPLLGSARRRARVRLRLRALDQRDVPHVRDPGPVGEQVDVQRSRGSAVCSLSSPSPIGADTRMASSRCHAARQIRLACDQQQSFYIRYVRIYRAACPTTGGTDPRRRSVKSAALRGLPRARDAF